MNGRSCKQRMTKKNFDDISNRFRSKKSIQRTPQPQTQMQQRYTFRNQADFYTWVHNKRAIGYARVSSDDQKRNETVTPQITIIETFCKTHTIQLVKGYKDEDRTGTTTRGRKIKNIIQDLEEDKADLVLIDKWDRGFRNKRDQWEFIDTIKTLKKVVWAINDSNDKVTVGIKSVLAENYSDEVSYNTLRGLKGRAQQGIYPSRLKGYIKYRTLKNNKLKIKQDPLWAPRIRETIKLYNKNKPWKEIQDITKLAKSTFINIINNTAYTSYIQYDDIKIPISYEPLFTEKERLQALQRYWKEKKHLRGQTQTELEKKRKDMLTQITQAYTPL